jgi:hypothetical protein
LGIGSICKECSRRNGRAKLEALGKVENICSICGRKELVYNTGKAKPICGGCSQKLSGKQKLPRGNYHIIYKPKTESRCRVCGCLYPATIQYWRACKVNKSGLNLGRCRKCLNRYRHKKERATLEGRLSTYIYKSLHGKKSGNHWESLVGWNIKTLIKRLEKQFSDGMTWDNYGKWHIDHIIPQNAFHYTSPNDIDFKRCWALSNLKPLWAEDNIAKSNKILSPFQLSLHQTK